MHAEEEQGRRCSGQHSNSSGVRPQTQSDGPVSPAGSFLADSGSGFRIFGPGRTERCNREREPEVVLNKTDRRNASGTAGGPTHEMEAIHGASCRHSSSKILPPQIPSVEIRSCVPKGRKGSSPFSRTNFSQRNARWLESRLAGKENTVAKFTLEITQAEDGGVFNTKFLEFESQADLECAKKAAVHAAESVIPPSQE